MSPLSIKELNLLVETMHQMQDAATNANWQELSRLDSERRALLKFDPTTVPLQTSKILESESRHSEILNRSPNSANNVTRQKAELVREIHSLDKQIIDTVQNARQKLLGENRELSAQLKAKKLYAQTSAMS